MKVAMKPNLYCRFKRGHSHMGGVFVGSYLGYEEFLQSKKKNKEKVRDEDLSFLSIDRNECSL